MIIRFNLTQNKTKMNGLQFFLNERIMRVFLVDAKVIVGTFTCKDVLEAEDSAFFIGGIFGGSHSLKGATSTLESYAVGKAHGYGGVPDALKNLVISHLLIINGHEERKIH